MIGKKYNSWTVLEDLGYDKWGCRIVICKCDCGTVKDKRWYAVENGKSKRCVECAKGKDLSGTRVGKWSVGDKIYISGRQEYYYQCICDCGNKTEVPGAILKSGKSNGCIVCGNRLAHHKTDALRRSIMHKTFYSMMARCYDRNNTNYKNYGARGIKVHTDWLIFENFLADMGERPVGLSLDRIDNDGNYEPSNCKWSSVKEQANNRRTSLKNRR